MLWKFALKLKVIVGVQGLRLKDLGLTVDSFGLKAWDLEFVGLGFRV